MDLSSQATLTRNTQEENMFKVGFTISLLLILALFTMPASAYIDGWPPGDRVDRVIQGQEKSFTHGETATFGIEAIKGDVGFLPGFKAVSNPEALIDKTLTSADYKEAMTPTLGGAAFLACSEPDKGAVAKGSSI
jgi:hypothetical protein